MPASLKAIKVDLKPTPAAYSQSLRPAVLDDEPKRVCHRRLAAVLPPSNSEARSGPFLWGNIIFWMNLFLTYPFLIRICTNGFREGIRCQANGKRM